MVERHYWKNVQVNQMLDNWWSQLSFDEVSTVLTEVEDVIITASIVCLLLRGLGRALTLACWTETPKFPRLSLSRTKRFQGHLSCSHQASQVPSIKPPCTSGKGEGRSICVSHIISTKGVLTTISVYRRCCNKWQWPTPGILEAPGAVGWTRWKSKRCHVVSGK